MRPCLYMFMLMLLLLAAGAGVGGAQAQPQASTPQPRASTSLADLIAQLDANDFKVREAATEQLITAGPPAVDALKAAAIGDSAEVTWRAVHVLNELAVAGDFDQTNAAEDALRHLAASPNLSAARRAADALEVLPGTRQARAIRMIQSLGGIIDEAGYSLRIDGAWKGGDGGLRYIRHIASLVAVQIEPTANVTDAGVRKLRASLTQHANPVKVTVFGKAFIGIGAASEDGARGMLVVQVSPKSPAADAGIEVDDVITRINGNAIEGFDDLVAMMRKREPGDKVEVELERIDKETRLPNTLKKQVTLGTRPGAEAGEK